jgi:alpha-methylacyl-CoA racemase
MNKVLSGLKVLEIAGIGPGPFAAMHLADLGADVICVQRPDGGRGALGPQSPINRGKRAVALDLKSTAGRDAVLALAEGADALIEGMRPGVMERLGLGPADCQARNPRLVYGRMTGWGQAGPLAQTAGHDLNYIALSGALWSASPAGQEPVTPFSVVGDIAGGALYLVIGLLAGVLRARAGEDGCVVDAAIIDGSAHSQGLLLAALGKGLLSAERGQGVHDAAPFYAAYRCADGRWLSVGAIEPQFHAELLRRLGLADDARFAAQWVREQWPAQKALLAARFATRTRDDWCALFEGSDACVAPVLAPEEAARHPHHAARGVFRAGPLGLEAAPAPRFGAQAYEAGPVPRAGQHTEAVLARLAAGGPAAAWARKADGGDGSDAAR